MVSYHRLVRVHLANLCPRVCCGCAIGPTARLSPPNAKTANLQTQATVEIRMPRTTRSRHKILHRHLPGFSVVGFTASLSYHSNTVGHREDREVNAVVATN